MVTITKVFCDSFYGVDLKKEKKTFFVVFVVVVCVVKVRLKANGPTEQQ